MRKSPLTNDKVKIKNMKNIDSKYVTLIFFLDLWKADYNDYNEQPVTVCKLCSLAVLHLRTEGTSPVNWSIVCKLLAIIINAALSI